MPKLLPFRSLSKVKIEFRAHISLSDRDVGTWLNLLHIICKIEAIVIVAGYV